MKRLPSRGFTLIELMITVAVVAILASVAYPSYIQYIVRTHRSAVQSQMYAVANKQEQYMLDARRYAGGDTDLVAGRVALDELRLTPTIEVSSRYNITATCTMPAAVGNCTEQSGVPTYTITATPIGAQAANDTKCSTLRLDYLGAKTPVTAGCW